MYYAQSDSNNFKILNTNPAPMKLLVPTDGSIYSENAAKVAGILAQKHEGEIILLHVVADTGFRRKTWRNKGAESILSELRNLLVNMGCDEYRIKCIIEDGNAPEKIVEVANLHNTDRIVMGTHGKTGIKKIMGSVTEKVLQISDVLVLVVPPGHNK